MDVICGTSKHAVRIAQELSKANRGESRAAGSWWSYSHIS